MIRRRIRAAAAGVMAFAAAGAAAGPLAEVQQTIVLRAGWNSVFLRVDAPVEKRAELLRSAAVSRLLMRAPAGPAAGPAKALSDPDWFDDAALWISRSIADDAEDPYESAAESLEPGRCYLMLAGEEAEETLSGAPSVQPQKWHATAGTLFGAHGDFAPLRAPTIRAYFAASTALSRSDAEFYKLTADEGWRKIGDLGVEPLEENGCLFVRAPFGSVYQGPLEVRPAGGAALSFSSEAPELFVRIVNRADKPVQARLTSEPIPAGAELEELPALFAWSTRDAVAPPDKMPRWTGIGDSEDAFVVDVPGLGAVDVVLGVNVAALRGWITGGAQGGATGMVTTVLTVAGGGARMRVPVEVALGGEVGAPRQLGLWVGDVMIDKVGLAPPQVDNELEDVPQPYRFRLIVHKAEDAGGVASCHLLSDAIEMPEVQEGTSWDGDSWIVISDEEKARERFMRLTAGAEGVRRFRTVAYVTDSPVPAHAAVTDAEREPCLSPGSAVRFEFAMPYDHPLNPDVHAAHPDHDNLDDSYRKKMDPGEEAREFVRTFTLTVSVPDPQGGRDYHGGGGWNDSRLRGVFDESIVGVYPQLEEGPQALRTSGYFTLFRISRARLQQDE